MRIPLRGSLRPIRLVRWHTVKLLSISRPTRWLTAWPCLCCARVCLLQTFYQVCDLAQPEMQKIVVETIDYSRVVLKCGLRTGLRGCDLSSIIEDESVVQNLKETAEVSRRPP